MRGWLWRAVGFGALVSLLAVLAIRSSPGGLLAAARGGSPKPQPAGPAIGAAAIGQPFALGKENTSFQVQNTGVEPARVVVDYYDPDGVRIAQDVVPELAPGAAAAFYQALHPDLPRGFAGSAVVTASQPVKTLIFKDIERNGVLSLGGDNGVAQGFNRQYLPVIYSRFGLNNAWSTRFAVSNVSPSITACVRMTYRRHSGEVVFQEPPIDGPVDPQCPHGGLPLPPQGVILRNQANMTHELPEQFEGSLIIDLLDNEVPASKQFVAATADIFNSERANFASYKGLGWSPPDTGELSTTVLLPLIFRNFGYLNGWNTHYQIITVDPSLAANVTVTYCCDGRLAGPGGSLQKTFSVQASAIVYQALEEELPNDFVGSAIVTSDQPIAVVDMMAWTFLDKATFGTFVGVPQSAASTTVWVPVVYKDFGWKGPMGTADGWNTWFQVQVADGGSANVRITYHGDKLAGGSVSFDASVTGSQTFYQHIEPLLPDDFEGAVVVTSDKPIVVVAGITSDAYEGDTESIFLGFGSGPSPAP